MRIRRLVLAATAGFVLLAACSRELEPVSRPAFAPLQLSLQHLRHLGLDAVVNRRPVRVVALYAEAPDYRPVGSPARDGYEGIAAVDDAARAAIVYLRSYEVTGDKSEQIGRALV